jgi:hypothetical protein
MDCGDSGHILLSREVATALSEISEWKDCLIDLGETEVKHGVRIHVFNLYAGDAGNSHLPTKISSKPAAQLKSEASHAKESNLGPIVFKMCDRGSQVEGFTHFFISNLQRQSGVPQVYFVPGGARECHDSLVERLVHTKIKHIVEKKWGEQRGTVVLKKTPWPHEGDFEQLQQELKLSLFSEFDPAYMGDDLSAQALSDQASKLLSALVVIRHNIYADRWTTTMRKLIMWYLDYWSAIKNNASGPQFLIFFNIIYPARVNSRWKTFLKFRTFDKQYVERALEDIRTSHSSACPCLIIKELVPPKQYEVEDWFSRHNIYDLKTQSDYLNRIFTTAAEQLSMADVEHELSKIHQSFLREKGYI